MSIEQSGVDTEPYVNDLLRLDIEVNNALCFRSLARLC